MKTQLTLLTFLTLSAPAFAQSYQSATGTGTTTAQVIFNTDSHLPSRIVSLDLTSDLSSSTLTFQSGQTSYLITAAATNLTNVVVAGYGTLASNDVVIIQTATGSLTNATVYSVVNSTNMNFKATSGLTLLSGDMIYRLANKRTISVGATTLRLNGEAIFVSDQDQPILLQLTGTSACTINNAVIFRGLR